MPAPRLLTTSLVGALFAASACGSSLPPAGPAPAALDLGAAFSLSIGGISPGDESRMYASAMFWPGDFVPEPGGIPRGHLHTLAKADRLWVNETPMELSIADWGPSYNTHALPESRDGRYTFRLDINGATLTRTVSVARVTLDEPPGGVLHVDGPATVSWRPALPSTSGVQVGLSSCVLAESLAVTSSSATLAIRLSALNGRCDSVLSVGYREDHPIGEPFRSGQLTVSTGATRGVVVLP